MWGVKGWFSGIGSFLSTMWASVRDCTAALRPAVVSLILVHISLASWFISYCLDLPVGFPQWLSLNSFLNSIMFLSCIWNHIPLCSWNSLFVPFSPQEEVFTTVNESSGYFRESTNQLGQLKCKLTYAQLSLASATFSCRSSFLIVRGFASFFLQLLLPSAFWACLCACVCCGVRVWKVRGQLCGVGGSSSAGWCRAETQLVGIVGQVCLLTNFFSNY